MGREKQDGVEFFGFHCQAKIRTMIPKTDVTNRIAQRTFAKRVSPASAKMINICVEAQSRLKSMELTEIRLKRSN